MLILTSAPAPPSTMGGMIASMLGPQNFMRLMSAIGTAKRVAGAICSATWTWTKKICIFLYEVISYPFRLLYTYLAHPCYVVFCAPGGCVYRVKECCFGCCDLCSERANPYRAQQAVGRSGNSETSSLLP